MLKPKDTWGLFFEGLEKNHSKDVLSIFMGVSPLSTPILTIKTAFFFGLPEKSVENV